MSDEKYEVRLYRIEGNNESIVEAKEVPVDRFQSEQQVSELPDREAMSLINANCKKTISLQMGLLEILSEGTLLDHHVRKNPS